MPRPSRRQLTVVLIGIVVLASLAVAVAAGGVLGGRTVDSEEPSSPGQPEEDSVGDTADGVTSSTTGSGGGNPVPPAGLDTPVSSGDSPRPQPTQISDPPTAFDGIRTFEQCAAAGYPVAESYPEQCRTPDGRLFVRVVD